MNNYFSKTNNSLILFYFEVWKIKINMINYVNMASQCLLFIVRDDESTSFSMKIFFLRYYFSLGSIGMRSKFSCSISKVFGRR